MTEKKCQEPAVVRKKELRERLRELLADIGPDQLHERSIQACTHLTETREYNRAKVLMVFLSLATEVGTTPRVLHAWQDRKRVLAPKVSWEQRRMLPIEIRSLSDDLSESRFGLREPAQGTPVPLGDIDLVVVPGLGFDLHGNRIGRGRGFYDHFLAHGEWHGQACGLALENQVVEDVPVKEHDMKVDMLVTEARVRRFAS